MRRCAPVASAFSGFGRVLDGPARGHDPTGRRGSARQRARRRALARTRARAGPRVAAVPGEPHGAADRARGNAVGRGQRDAPFDGRGERDHSWGPRHWNLEWTFLVLNGPDLRVQCAEARIPNIDPIHGGYLSRGETETVSITRARFDFAYHDDDVARPVEGRLEIVAEDGTRLAFEVEPIAATEIDITHTFAPPQRSVYRRALVRARRRRRPAATRLDRVQPLREVLRAAGPARTRLRADPPAARRMAARQAAARHRARSCRRSPAPPRPVSPTTRCSSTCESVEDGRREHRALVARIEPTGFGIFPRYDLTLQYRVMAALRGTDVPVPRMFWFEPDATLLGAPFYVMERVDGPHPDRQSALPRGRLDDRGHAGRARRHLVERRRHARRDPRLRRREARHRLPRRAAAGNRHDRVAARALEALRGVGHRRSAAFPTIEAGWQWLVANRPPPSQRRDLLLGRRADRQHDLPRRPLRRGARLGDGDARPGRDGPRLVPASWTATTARASRRRASRASPTAPRRSRAGKPRVGRSAEHVAFWEAFTAWRFTVIMARVGDQMQSLGILPADSTFPADNTASRLLVKTLDLVLPGS